MSSIQSTLALGNLLDGKNSLWSPLCLGLVRRTQGGALQCT